MHLCGRLSLQAVEAYAQLDEVRSLVLSPCCLPPKRDAASPAHLFASRDAKEQYTAWASHLEVVLHQADKSATFKSLVVPDILSPRNAVLTATKNGQDRKRGA